MDLGRHYWEVVLVLNHFQGVFSTGVNDESQIISHKPFFFSRLVYAWSIKESGLIVAPHHQKIGLQPNP